MNSLNSRTEAPRNGNYNLTSGLVLNAGSETLGMKEKETTLPVMDNKLRTITERTVRDSFVNLDDVNVMTSTRVDKVAGRDESDSALRRRSNKPTNYAAKKTVAQGMIDIALLTSNANQLRNLIAYQNPSGGYWFVLAMIAVSLVLQISVGISLIFKGRFDNKGRDKAAAARVNNWVMAGVFMITIINIFIAAFDTGSTTPSRPVPQNMSE